VVGGHLEGVSVTGIVTNGGIGAMVEEQEFED
jgi:hypothetical protein